MAVVSEEAVCVGENIAGIEVGLEELERLEDVVAELEEDVLVVRIVAVQSPPSHWGQH